MSAFDFAARGLAAQGMKRLDRGAVSARLARTIAATWLRLPELMAAPPTIAAASTTPAVTGTLWAPWVAGVATHLDKYSLLRGTWRTASATYPQYGFAIPDVVTQGDGTEGGKALNPNDPVGGLVRFYCEAPDLEINWYGAGGSTTAAAYRLRVDGQYAATGCIGLGSAGAAGGQNNRITWGDGSAANRRTRLYEIEGITQFKFGGVRSAAIYPPRPAPAPDQLRIVVSGDSFTTATGALATALQPALGYQLALLLGQPDVTVPGIGGTGFVATSSGTRNTFIQHVQPDIIARNPHVIVELGGLNDNSFIGSSAATMEELVTAWLAAVTAALPNVLIFMTGPMTPRTASDIGAGLVAAAAGKKAAAAKFANNVVYIDNIAEGWVLGTGGNKSGAPNGTGNADWITGGSDGSDGTHATQEGHGYLAQRIATAIAAWVGVL